MKNCIDCGVELTEKTRSAHQPEIRCLNCFEIFADGVEETLENMIKDMGNKNGNEKKGYKI